jgi:hypothetical protein
MNPPSSIAPCLYPDRYCPNIEVLLEPFGTSTFLGHTLSVTTSVEVGKNEALFRAVNNRIRDVSDDLEPSVPVEFICECSRQDCTAAVSLTLSEYATIRSDSTWFAVVPGHMWDESSEHVVARHESHWVVEKDGVAAAVADAL